MSSPDPSDVSSETSTPYLHDTKTSRESNATHIFPTVSIFNGNEQHFRPWDNPDNIISFEMYQTLSFVSNCFLYPALFVIGVPSNGINCLIFCRQGLKDRMNLCLFCLALVDMSYLIVLMVQAFSTFVTLADEVLGAEYYAKSLVYCLGIGWGFKAASGCISMVIAVERCLCVMRPLQLGSIMRTRTMLWILVVIVVGTQLAQVIQPLAYTVQKVEDVERGEVHWNILTTKLYADNRVILEFILVVLLPFLIPVVTLVVVVITTAVTVVKLKTASRWREKSSMTFKTGHRQGALTVVLVLLSCIYVTCTSPLVAVTLVRLLVFDFSPEGRYSNICIASHLLGTVFSAVNSAINFFVYFFRSSRYRGTLRDLCRGNPTTMAKLTDVSSTSY